MSNSAATPPDDAIENVWEKQAALLRADLKALQSFVDDLDDDALRRAFNNVRGAAICHLHTQDPDTQQVPINATPQILAEISDIANGSGEGWRDSDGHECWNTLLKAAQA
jgi:hypothetical protein